MARTLDPVAQAVRRDAFLDAAQRLIQAKGYAQMSIQDVLAELSASKGAFYHYFDSKAALLEGVVSRMVDVSTMSLAQMVADPRRSALDKFDGVFSGVATFKAERKELILALGPAWLSDENAVTREKFRHRSIAALTPILASIIRQGAAEGDFVVASPDHTARVFASLVSGANEAAMQLLYASLAGTVPIGEVEQALAAFGDAFERVLGAEPGALRFDKRLAALREWFDLASPTT